MAAEFVAMVLYTQPRETLGPKEVTKSLGLKAVIDPLTLRVFGRIKHQADAVLEGCGVRFLSGWAVPEGKAAVVFAALDGIVTMYNDEKTAFLTGYDANVTDWAARNPGFSREILEGKVDIAAVAEKISAGYEAFRLQPVTASGAQALANRVGGLGGELIADIAQIARNFFKESFLGKNRANPAIRAFGQRREHEGRQDAGVAQQVRSHVFA